uniref:Mitochondrial carrier protein n=1 Tax=Solanum tuberosum TaxID=4113 RepID=M1AWB6_SOLTU
MPDATCRARPIFQASGFLGGEQHTKQARHTKLFSSVVIYFILSHASRSSNLKLDSI